MGAKERVLHKIEELAFEAVGKLTDRLNSWEKPVLEEIHGFLYMTYKHKTDPRGEIERFVIGKYGAHLESDTTVEYMINDDGKPVESTVKGSMSTQNWRRKPISRENALHILQTASHTFPQAANLLAPR